MTAQETEGRVAAPPPPPQPRRAIGVAVLALVLLASALLPVVGRAGWWPVGTSEPPEPVSTPAPVPPPAPKPAKGSLPVGDLPGWRQTIAEDFATDVTLGSFPGPAYQDRWGVYENGWSDTSRRGRYVPASVLSVRDGVLNKRLHSARGVPQVAALLPVGEGQLYGRSSVRFRADPVPGFKTAWLWWPDSDEWPEDGEIDFPEGELDSTIHAFMHRVTPLTGQDVFDTGVGYDSWHVATTEWVPGKVTFILDGKVVGVSTRGVPTKPMHLVLQTETALEGARPDPDAVANVQIDWVALYARA